MVLPAGTVLQHYSIEKLLGEGAMGSVYRARHAKSGEHVAIKVMSEEASKHQSARKRFVREARASMAANHPNVVRMIEVFEHDGQPVLVMEMLSGQDFEAFIEERGGKVGVVELARIMVRVTSAVGTAHALGIVHRDLKPQNIFITQAETFGVKVLDFGIAKLRATHGLAAGTGALTETGALLGTPFYMAPEQAVGAKDIDHRADIWSLGIILYRCLTGVIPTDGTSFGAVFRKVVLADFEPIQALVPELPADLSEMVKSMIAKERDDRPWDLCNVHALLARYAQESAPSFQTAIRSNADPVDEVSNSGVTPPPSAPLSVSSVSGAGATPLESMPRRVYASGALPHRISQADVNNGPTGADPSDARTLLQPSADQSAAKRPNWLVWAVLFALVALAALGVLTLVG